MAQVQINCPNSGLWAWTGVEEDPDHWEPASLAGRELPCGICGERHLAAHHALRIPDWSRSSLASPSITKSKARQQGVTQAKVQNPA
jgi:hypothetical protein